MTLTYHCNEHGVVVCSLCGQNAQLCNVWDEQNRCVERRVLNVLEATATSI